MTQLFDPGLQPERTELAWRRTALSFVVGSLLALRLLPAAFENGWWSLAGVAGLAASALVWIMARRRSRAVNSALAAEGEHASMPGAALLAILAALTTAAGLAGAAIAVAISAPLLF